MHVCGMTHFFITRTQDTNFCHVGVRLLLSFLLLIKYLFQPGEQNTALLSKVTHRCNFALQGKGKLFHMRFPQFNATGSPRGPQGIFKTGVIGIGQICSNASQLGQNMQL